MALKYVDEVALEGKRVIARFDFNVPLDKNGSGKITDTTRVDAALETIRYILSKNPSKLILMSHLGRPKGEVKKELSLEPVASYLADQLDEDVVLSESLTGTGLQQLLKLNQSRILLLENIRFSDKETKNDKEFAKSLASLAEVYVNDAFGTAHRAHASTNGIVAYAGTSVGGFLLRKEVQALNQVLETPQKPFVAIMGGAKISDKIKILEQLLSNVSELLVGGAMAYPFLKAKGFEVGNSLCADEEVALAKKILSQSNAKKIVLPVDHRVGENPDSKATDTEKENIPSDMMGLDIGPNTEALFASKIRTAKTVLWNGPMGFFEKDEFAKGSLAVAKAMSECPGFTLVGGGDSVSAINKAGLADKITHVSTGGGASLEYIEKGTLPGIQALKFGVDASKL